MPDLKDATAGKCKLETKSGTNSYAAVGSMGFRDCLIRYNTPTADEPVKHTSS